MSQSGSVFSRGFEGNEQMNEPNRIRPRSVFLTVTFGLLVMLLSMGTEAHASASNAITSLAFDKSNNRLFKLQGGAAFESKDGGQTWTKISLPAQAHNAQMLGLSADSSTLYVAEVDQGVFRKEFTSSNWTAADTGLPGKDIRAFTTHATQPATIYAFVAKQGIYRSQNAGKDWRKMDRGPEEANQMIHSNMAGSMDSGWLYVVTPRGIRLSMDCFCLWRDIGDPKDQISALAFEREKPDHVFAASARGVLRSINGGRDWELASTPGPLITALTVNGSGIIYAGTEDGELYRSHDSGKTWELAGA